MSGSKHQFGTLRINESGVLDPHTAEENNNFNVIPGIDKFRVGLPLEESMYEKGNTLPIYLRERYINKERIGFLALFLCSNDRLEFDATTANELHSNFVNDSLLSSTDWRQTIVARVTPWIDCDVKESTPLYESIRENSKLALEEDLKYYSYLGVRAIHIPLKTFPCYNLAEVLKDFCDQNPGHPPIWIQVPLVTDAANVDEAWIAWYKLRSSIGSQHNISVVLNVQTSSLWDQNGEEYNGLGPVLDRWMAEPVAGIILPVEYYKSGANFLDRSIENEGNFENSVVARTMKSTPTRRRNDSSHVGYDTERSLAAADDTLREESVSESVKGIIGPYSPADKKSRKSKEIVYFDYGEGFPTCFIRFLKQVFQKEDTCFLLDSQCLHLRANSLKTEDPQFKLYKRRMSSIILEITPEVGRARQLSESWGTGQVAAWPFVKIFPPFECKPCRPAPVNSNLCHSPAPVASDAVVNTLPPLNHMKEQVISPLKVDTSATGGHQLQQTPPLTPRARAKKISRAKYDEERDYNPFWMAVHRVLKEECLDWYTEYNLKVGKGLGRDPESLPNRPAFALEKKQTYIPLGSQNVVYDLYETAITRVLLAQESTKLKDKPSVERKLNIVIVNACGYQLIDHVIHISHKLKTKPKCWITVVESKPSRAMTLRTLNQEKWGKKLSEIYVGNCDDKDSPLRLADRKADVVIVDCFTGFACDGMAPEKIDQIRRFCGSEAVFIPETYGNYLCPVMMPKYHSLSHKVLMETAAKKNKVETNYFQGDERCDTPYVVSSDGALPLAEYQTLFEYNTCAEKDAMSDEMQAELLIPEVKNLLKGLEFTIGQSAELTGFLGYASIKLSSKFRNNPAVYLSTLPDRHTPHLECLFPVFFPLRTSVYVEKGEKISVEFGRRTTISVSNDYDTGVIKTGYRMWYEWRLAEPYQNEGQFSMALNSDDM